MRIVVLSTMLTDRKGLGEWGFSALVEAGGRRLLFDTGGRPDVVLQNAEALGHDLASVEDVVLSHGHWDHTGGLVALRRELSQRNPAALCRAHVAPGFFAQRTLEGKPAALTREARAEYEALGGVFLEHAHRDELWPGVWVTGPIPRPHPEHNLPSGMVTHTPAGPVPDEVPEDMALVVDGPDGLVVVVGCGHAGAVNTVEAASLASGGARVDAVIGGLHLYEADDAVLSWTGRELRRLGVAHIMGTHCTGLEAVYRLRTSAGLDRRTCVVGAVGATYEPGKGISPGGLAR